MQELKSITTASASNSGTKVLKGEVGATGLAYDPLGEALF
jgi:hypothetical protein